MSAEALTGENLFHDPYPVYARLRREAPVCPFPETGEWLVTRWTDCQAVGMNDPIFGPSDSSGRPEARVMGMPNVLSMSGEPHRCLREGIDGPLAAEKVDGYVDRMTRPVVRRCIEALKKRGEADLTAELFEPISVRVIGDLIGLVDFDVDTLIRWFHALNDGLQRPNDPLALAACEHARNEIDAAMRTIIERVTASPDDTLTSHVVHGGISEGRVRSFDEIMPTMRVILLGGLQEPGHGAANAALGLLQNPEQAAAMSADPGGLALKAYDEGLRWIAPIGVTPRLAVQDFELAGAVIPKGASVAIVMASANRDEGRFENPDSFDLARKRKPHAAFGYRPHFCSGHYLSRQIGRILLEETFLALPTLCLDPDREAVTQGWRFRGVLHLPARWRK